MVHEWTGINPNIKKRVEELAELGFIAFAADVYGKGIRPQNNKEAAGQAKIYKSDRVLMRKRVNAGLEVLRNNKYTNSSRIAAIGYCFGGTCILELARSGAEINGFVSFHGGLDATNSDDAKNIKGKVLILHGADDPHVPLEEVQAFQDEMRNAGTDWQMVYYGDAVHSFTNQNAGTDNSRGAAYNELAARRSWQAMQTFFKEIFQ